MRIIFNSLDPVKKEAIKLHKAAKSVGLKSKLSIAQNLISEAYGWSNFNEMSLMYGRISENGLFDSVDSKGVVHVDSMRKSDAGIASGIRLMSSLSANERLLVQTKLSAKVIEYTRTMGANGNQEGQVSQTFTTSKSGVDNLLSNDYKLTSLASALNDAFRRTVLIKGGDQLSRVSLYSGMPLEKAGKNGGIFMLDKGVAKPFYPRALELAGQDNVFIIDFDKDAGKDDFPSCHHVNFNALDYGRLGVCPMMLSLDAEIKEMERDVESATRVVIVSEPFVSEPKEVALLAFLSEFGYLVPDDEKKAFHFDLRQKISAYQEHNEKHGHMSLTSYFLRSDESRDSLTTFVQRFMIAPFKEGSGEWSERLRFYIQQHEENASLGLSKSIGFLSKVMPMLSMMRRKMDEIDVVSRGNEIVKDSERHTLDSLVLTDAIIIVTGDMNNPLVCRNIRIVLSTIRVLFSVHLGVSVEGQSKRSDSPSIKDKVLVLDRMEKYYALGSAVVFAQYRSLGISSFIHLSDRLNNDREYFSISVNIGVVIHFHLPNEMDDAVVSAIGLYKGNPDIQNYLIQQLNGEVDVLSKRQEVAVSILKRFSSGDGQAQWVNILIKKEG